MIKQKIMKTVYRFLLVALLAMAATSCLYEDKGNYDYHAINDITIGGIASGQEYPVVSFVDTLRIKPQITCAQSTDESTLEYQWSVLITEGEQYEKIAKEKHGQVYYGCDLIDEIWEERPALSEKPAFYLEETYTGESTASKLKPEARRDIIQRENGERKYRLSSSDQPG